MKLLEATLESVPVARPIPTDDTPQGLCLDRGYDYDQVRDLAAAQRFEAHIRTRGEELAAIGTFDLEPNAGPSRS